MTAPVPVPSPRRFCLCVGVHRKTLRGSQDGAGLRRLRRTSLSGNFDVFDILTKFFRLKFKEMTA